jgi:hypothetical protein
MDGVPSLIKGDGSHDRDFVLRSPPSLATIELSTSGSDTSHQKAAHWTGRKPSAMCIARAGAGDKKNAEATEARDGKQAGQLHWLGLHSVPRRREGWVVSNGRCSD